MNNGFPDSFTPVGNNMGLASQANFNGPQLGHCVLNHVNAREVPVSNFSHRFATAKNSHLDFHRVNQTLVQADVRQSITGLRQPQSSHAKETEIPVPSRLKAKERIARIDKRSESNAAEKPTPERLSNMFIERVFGSNKNPMESLMEMMALQPMTAEKPTPERLSNMFIERVFGSDKSAMTSLMDMMELKPVMTEKPESKRATAKILKALVARLDERAELKAAETAVAKSGLKATETAVVKPAPQITEQSMAERLSNMFIERVFGSDKSAMESLMEMMELQPAVAKKSVARVKVADMPAPVKGRKKMLNALVTRLDERLEPKRPQGVVAKLALKIEVNLMAKAATNSCYQNNNRISPSGLNKTYPPVRSVVGYNSLSQEKFTQKDTDIA